MPQNSQIRASAFLWLAEQVGRHGDVLPRTTLAKGFEFQGARVPLLGPQGIFRPKVLTDAPLSITTSPNGPYDDAFDRSGLLRYRYRGSNRDHPENVGLRFAMTNRLPLVYFHGVVPGKYLATWPVFVVNDDPESLSVFVAVEDAKHSPLASIESNIARDADQGAAQRVYATAAVRVRLHQRSFRERVLTAYKRQCAFCRFKHEELLDAAHIVPDSHPVGEPVVQNGLALCTLHHSAFDRYFLGVRPDHTIEVRPDILLEKDGPTLAHGIQSLHGTKLLAPRSLSSHPAKERLQFRYEEFRKAFV